jgi:6-phospho-3-hexuloisomerase
MRRLEEAAEDLVRVLRGVKAADLRAFEEAVLSSHRAFVTGLGRTGLMMRGFAMRLMHLGRRAYHVGDVITPAIRRDDLLIIGSRTGRSPVVAVVTANPQSMVARRADVVLAIDDRAIVERRKRRQEPYLPLGSLFEQALLLVLDQTVVDLMDALDLTERDLARIHTRFE